MLQCSMSSTTRGHAHLHTELDDLLGSLTSARRQEDLGRLAYLTYWEVRRWARTAKQQRLAEHSARVITDHPHATRDSFLRLIDGVISELEVIRRDLH